MFQSSLKEAQAFQDFYLPKTGSYYRDNRNYSYDSNNHRNTTSLLSPYIRYRLLSEEDIIKKTLSINSFVKTEKFIQEIYWRTYWKGWLEHRPDVYGDYLTQRNELLKNLSNTIKYQKAIEGETHLTFFNDWVKKIKKDGYLHNHIRMWFASIWIFTLELPWQLGANFFMENLLDGDPASNTLSWRWVAGIQTKGKHYLARKNNIIKYGNLDINENIKLNEQ
ncbi:DNA photolyase, partial [Alphaproteobacteria bacterium]|nr:DNA photolyase [Alphaproteobacteria bacterium]